MTHGLAVCRLCGEPGGTLSYARDQQGARGRVHRGAPLACFQVTAKAVDKKAVERAYNELVRAGYGEEELDAMLERVK